MRQGLAGLAGNFRWSPESPGLTKISAQIDGLVNWCLKGQEAWQLWKWKPPQEPATDGTFKLKDISIPRGREEGEQDSAKIDYHEL